MPEADVLGSLTRSGYERGVLACVELGCEPGRSRDWIRQASQRPATFRRRTCRELVRHGVRNEALLPSRIEHAEGLVPSRAGG